MGAMEWEDISLRQEEDPLTSHGHEHVSRAITLLPIVGSGEGRAGEVAAREKKREHAVAKGWGEHGWGAAHGKGRRSAKRDYEHIVEAWRGEGRGAGWWGDGGARGGSKGENGSGARGGEGKDEEWRGEEGGERS